MEVLRDIGHDGSFIGTDVTDIFYVQEGLSQICLGGGALQGYRFVRRRQMRVRSFCGDYGVGGSYIEEDLVGIDRLERS